MTYLPRIVETSEICALNRAGGPMKLIVFRVETQPDIVVPVPVAFLDPFQSPTLFRLNSACMTSEAFGDTQCDCKWQLDRALDLIVERGSGLVIYVPHHEGRGVGLFHKVNTMRASQDHGLSTKRAFEALGHSADHREYSFIKPILTWFGIERLENITNNPEKTAALRDQGIEVTRTVSVVSTDAGLRRYLTSKRDEFAHQIEI